MAAGAPIARARMGVANPMGDVFRLVVQHVGDHICSFVEGNVVLARRFCPPPRNESFIVMNPEYAEAVYISAMTEGCWRSRVVYCENDEDGGFCELCGIRSMDLAVHDIWFFSKVVYLEMDTLPYTPEVNEMIREAMVGDASMVQERLCCDICRLCCMAEVMGAFGLSTRM